MTERLTEQQLGLLESFADEVTSALCAEIRACWAERGGLTSRVAALQADKLNLSAVVKTPRCSVPCATLRQMRQAVAEADAHEHSPACLGFPFGHYAPDCNNVKCVALRLIDAALAKPAIEVE
jgi:hypothetical protein